MGHFIALALVTLRAHRLIVLESTLAAPRLWNDMIELHVLTGQPTSSHGAQTSLHFPERSQFLKVCRRSVALKTNPARMGKEEALNSVTLIPFPNPEAVLFSVFLILDENMRGVF